LPDKDAARPSLFSALSLRRITTSGTYIPEIDGLRFIAITSVVLYHVPIQIALRTSQEVASNPIWRLISQGKRGVELFFLISGFILGMPFAAHLLVGRKAVRLKEYFLRRVTRLEPPYILAILIRLPLLLLVMHKPVQDVLTHGLASLFYLHSLIFGSISSINPPAWSLEVEIQFYCLAPLFAWCYFALRPPWLRRFLGLAFILAAGILQLHFLGSEYDSRASLSILDFAQYFFSGFLLCDLYLTSWDRIPRHWAWDALSAVCWLWIFAAQGSQVHTLLPVAALIAYVGAFKGVVFPRFFRLTWVSILGGMCYSIYLTHNLAITAVEFVFRRLFASPGLPAWERTSIAYAATIPAVLAVGLLLYMLVERPCMDKNWPAKLWRRLRAGKSPAIAVP
jgi:peptidoglycan/LPS O-acetylase OafA/YrhL